MRTPAPDSTTVQASSHRVQPRLYARSPEGGDFVELRAITATVNLYEAGVANTRSLTAAILIEDVDGFNILNGDLWSTFGTWIKAEQLVYRNDGSTFVVPWGFFRLNTFTVEIMTGSISFTASDAFSQLDDHLLMTLRDHTLATSDVLKTRLGDTLAAAFSTIPSFWTTIFDPGPQSSNNVKAARVYVHQGDDRSGFVRLLAYWLGRTRLVCPASGPLFRLVELRNPEATEQTADAVILDGGFGNLVDEGFTDTIDRGDIFNTVTVTYTRVTPITGARTRTDQRRMVVEYDDVDMPARVSGPFGRIGASAVALDVTSDAAALSAGTAAINASMTLARQVSMYTSPLYGLEPGDTLYVRTPTSVVMSGRVIGATIPLKTGEGDWLINMVNYKALDQSWKPKYSITTEASTVEDLADWQPFSPRSRIACDIGFPVGWNVSGASKVYGGITLRAIAVGNTDVIFKSHQSWSDSNAEHRYRARASIGLNNHGAYCDIGLNYEPGGVVWSKRVWVGAKKSKVLGVDVTVPASATSFGLYVRFSNRVKGSDFRMYNVTVEKAVRQKV